MVSDFKEAHSHWGAQTSFIQASNVALVTTSVPQKAPERPTVKNKLVLEMCPNNDVQFTIKPIRPYNAIVIIDVDD